MRRSYWTELTDDGTVLTVKMHFGNHDAYEIKLFNSNSEIDAHLARLKQWLLEDMEEQQAIPRIEPEIPEDFVLLPADGYHVWN